MPPDLLHSFSLSRRNFRSLFSSNSFYPSEWSGWEKYMVERLSSSPSNWWHQPRNSFFTSFSSTSIRSIYHGASKSRIWWTNCARVELYRKSAAWIANDALKFLLPIYKSSNSLTLPVQCIHWFICRVEEWVKAIKPFTHSIFCSTATRLPPCK